MLGDILLDIYRWLFDHFGPQGWWPAEDPFEVCLGAILTQNTNWGNVKRAIENLKRENLLSPRALREISVESLASLIRPSGYYNVKARRVKNFVSFLTDRYEGDINNLRKEDPLELRRKLLSIKGLGPETTDSILLYALDLPFFVVDAYTHRILCRHGLIPEVISYDELQEIFHQNLVRDVPLYKEFHALFVACGKTYCKKQSPRCDDCPLSTLDQKF
ncbi:MAG: endonuclease III domain-containing protein [Caldimicrobium sp.]|nr:endonuclease III domain-containing protein [Caldimicrobium sp.]MCX7613795.1 endonuclease III domain-containing protein [Caldimicrobium sp.]MDW8182622.1 endonuclease III domain-containing protein [Caldimicrobium sp.]